MAGELAKNSDNERRTEKAKSAAEREVAKQRNKCQADAVVSMPHKVTHISCCWLTTAAPGASCSPAWARQPSHQWEWVEVIGTDA